MRVAQDERVTPELATLGDFLVEMLGGTILRATVFPTPALETLFKTAVHEPIARRWLWHVNRVIPPEVEPADGWLRLAAKFGALPEVEDETSLCRIALRIAVAEVGNAVMIRCAAQKLSIDLSSDEVHRRDLMRPAFGKGH